MRTAVKPKRRDGVAERGVEDRIAVVQHKPRSHLPGKGLAELLACPCRRRRRRDIDVQNAPTVVGEDDQDEEQATRDCRHREEVDGDERADVVLEERPPRLGRRPTPTGHQP